jgi:hypothetical protein
MDTFQQAKNYYRKLSQNAINFSSELSDNYESPKYVGKLNYEPLDSEFYVFEMSLWQVLHAPCVAPPAKNIRNAGNSIQFLYFKEDEIFLVFTKPHRWMHPIRMVYKLNDYNEESRIWNFQYVTDKAYIGLGFYHADEFRRVDFNFPCPEDIFEKFTPIFKLRLSKPVMSKVMAPSPG